MPCEDKSIFCFYAFGVSRDWKQAFRILNFYGFGLFLANITIGTILSYFAAGLGAFFRDNVDRFIWNAVSSLSLMISGSIMIIQIYRKRYWPHSDQYQELTESIGTLRARKRTAFLLGLLAGIPPCIFEIAVYIHAMGFAIQYGWGNGVWTVFFFGIGTWIGLFPLAILGTISGKFSNFIKNANLRRTFIRNKKPNYVNGENTALNSKKNQSSENAPNSPFGYSKLEFFSGALLIALGVIFLILAVLKIDVFYWSEPPRVPAPFNIFK